MGTDIGRLRARTRTQSRCCRADDGEQKMRPEPIELYERLPFPMQVYALMMATTAITMSTTRNALNMENTFGVSTATRFSLDVCLFIVGAAHDGHSKYE